VRFKEVREGKHLIRMSEQPGLSKEEYQRRKVFLEHLKGLSEPEYIEIVRLLKKHQVPFSENLNGIFFNVTNLSQESFQDLEAFLEFTQQNRRHLADRDILLSTLTSKTDIE
jgi:hypothetical protein